MGLTASDVRRLDCLRPTDEEGGRVLALREKLLGGDVEFLLSLARREKELGLEVRGIQEAECYGADERRRLPMFEGIVLVSYSSGHREAACDKCQDGRCAAYEDIAEEDRLPCKHKNLPERCS